MKTILASVLAGALALTAMATTADAAIGVRVGPVGIHVGHYQHNHHWYRHRHWEHHHWRYW